MAAEVARFCEPRVRLLTDEARVESKLRDHLNGQVIQLTNRTGAPP
jgi:hypothetical protein